ncbi:MAG: hypothetical protein DBP03_11835 [gamma proteobacterium symbiont of Ctena orbiculata]|nr:MAG: hypothetical protein DBP03_11835 [gamma proteobacterium symbiont of Ctena orbiculata]
MCIEGFFEDYTSTIAFLGAVGTVVAAAVAVLVVRQNSKELRRIRLSGLSVKDIDDNGVLYLQNNTDIDLRITTSINRDIIDEKEKNTNFKNILSSDTWMSNKFDEIHNDVALSKGEVLVIHLKDIVAERTYIALVALKIIFSEKHKNEFGKAKYYLFRYAGDLAKNDSEISGKYHPHKKWILECSKTK